MSRPKKTPIEDPLARTIKKFKRKIYHLSKISGFTENQVIDDLFVHGAEETEEFYLEIQAFRTGGEKHAEPETNDLESIAPEPESNGSGAHVFDTFPDPSESPTEPDGAEAALNRLGDPQLGRGLRSEDEEVTVASDESSASDDIERGEKNELF